MTKSRKRDTSEPWAYGDEADVYWNESYEGDFKTRKVDQQSAANIEATLRRMYVRHGPADMPGGRERLNRNEGRHLVDGKRVMVWAFKHRQLRVYGVEGSVNGKRAFFASEVEPRKKQDGANQAQLKRAAERADELVKRIKGARL